MDKHLFLTHIAKHIEAGSLHKITLSKYVGATLGLQNLYIRVVQIKQSSKLSFLYRYDTKDITQNYTISEGLQFLKTLLGNDFLSADALTTQADYTLLFNKKRVAKILQKKPSQPSIEASMAHNKQKNRTLQPSTPLYLNALGISNMQGEIIKEGQKKYKQIDKYIEIIHHTLKNHPLPTQAHILDMGAGKGYLTFALYDFLKNQSQLNVTMTGIELRPHLVDFCNDLAQQCHFEGLDFIAQDIFDYDAPSIDMLIALHACDIATDIAIAKGIMANAQVIVVAPCCHKQIRKAMHTKSAMSAIMKFGIMEERQAELLTDGIRALLLESRGYQVKALEFVSVEHTPKNVMLIAIKTDTPNPTALHQINEIKAQFGIETHFLEELLEKN